MKTPSQTLESPWSFTQHGDIATRARALTDRYGTLPALALLTVMLREEFAGRIALVSSFGTESAVLLDLVARVDPATPVLFLDTGRIFDRTWKYIGTLTERCGLADVRVLRAEEAALTAADPAGALWRSDPDACCHLRKVAPLEQALSGFDAWITGRKRFQGGARASLPVIEVEGSLFKINPLAGWSARQIMTYFQERHLPRHDLEAQGYRSIGCFTCTDRVEAGEDPRAGRWRGHVKTECGIHGGMRASPAAPPGP